MSSASKEGSDADTHVPAAATDGALSEPPLVQSFAEANAPDESCADAVVAGGDGKRKPSKESSFCTCIKQGSEQRARELIGHEYPDALNMGVIEECARLPGIDVRQISGSFADPRAFAIEEEMGDELEMAASAHAVARKEMRKYSVEEAGEGVAPSEEQVDVAGQAPRAEHRQQDVQVSRGLLLQLHAKAETARLELALAGRI